MIFKQWRQVLNGTKTQTRRPVKPNEYAIHGAPGYAELPIEAVLIKPRHAQKWVVGRTYAVQPGRGKKAVGRIRVTKIRRERLGDISDADCYAEGILEVEILDPLLRRLAHYPYHLVCPLCDGAYETPQSAYACLWDCCGGRWEQDQNDDVWALEFEKGPGL